MGLRLMEFSILLNFMSGHLNTDGFNINFWSVVCRLRSAIFYWLILSWKIGYPNSSLKEIMPGFFEGFLEFKIFRALQSPIL